MSANADRLYGLFPDEFVAERNKLAASLRKGGRREEADAVKALAKPSVAAWAVNQLARRRRRQLDAFLRAAAALRKAQARGGAAFVKARDEERAARGELVELARDLVGEAGRKPTEAVLQSVRATLAAAAADDEAAEAVRQGRLVKELEPVGFGSWAGVVPARRAPQGPSKAALRREAQKAVREARARADEAERAVRKAQAQLTEAEQAARAADEELAEAEQRLREL